MKIDTEGTYTLRYTAEDECGNVTTEDRTVNVINITYSTVLFTDGTFIINEKSTDRDANIALHGAVTNEYIPYLSTSDYFFTAANQQLWKSVASSILRVEFGSVVKPVRADYWFYGLSSCREFDFTNCDWSDVSTMRYMLQNTAPSENFTFDCGNGKPTSIEGLFRGMSVWVSGGWVYVKNIKVIMDTSRVTNMNTMFQGSYGLETIDISSFNTPALTNTSAMFRDCTSLKTIFASNGFDVSRVTNSTGMFHNLSTNLFGGAGTQWINANPTDKTYAHIDGGTADPGYFTAQP